jgi:hypothetical protein
MSHTADGLMPTSDINWISEARALFNVNKPEHFADYKHCCECEEHDETLVNNDVKTISMAELGNGGWDPMCFCDGEGFLYYAPALVRLSLETADTNHYFAQLMFHLEYDFEENRFLKACNDQQRAFIAEFVTHFALSYPALVELYDLESSTNSVIAMWSKSASQGS